MRQRAECPTCREWLIIETNGSGRHQETCPHCDMGWPKERKPPQPTYEDTVTNYHTQSCADCDAPCRQRRCLGCSYQQTKRQQRTYDQRRKQRSA